MVLKTNQSGRESSYSIKVTIKYAKIVWLHVFPSYFFLEDYSDNGEIKYFLCSKNHAPPDFPVFMKVETNSSMIAMITGSYTLPCCVESNNCYVIYAFDELLDLVESLNSVYQFVSPIIDIESSTFYPGVFKNSTRRGMELIAYYARMGLLKNTRASQKRVVVT